MPITRVAKFTKENKAVQVSCGDNYTHVLTESGQVYSFGKATHGRLGIDLTYTSDASGHELP